MAPPPLRLALRDTVSRDDIDDVACELGWQLTNILPPAAGQPGQMIFATAAGDGFVYVVEDAHLGVVYLAGMDDAARASVEQARPRLPSYDSAEADALCASADPSTRHQGLVLTALLCPPSEARLASFVAALSAVDPPERAIALGAAGYAAWPALGPALARMASEDPVPQLRASAARLLAALAEDER